MDPTTHQLIAQMRARRRELGLTQDALARRASIPTTVIASIESGRRHGVRLNEAIALADALECDLGDLIDVEPVAQEGSA